MTDIALCLDNKCPSRRSCLRFTTQSGKWGTYATFGRVHGNDKCEGYVEVFSQKEVKRSKSKKSIPCKNDDNCDILC